MESTRFDNFRRFLVGVWRVLWPVMRQVLGWTCIALGVLGLVLPLLQGVLLLVIGVALVGRRNIVIRRSTILIKRLLRRWAALPTPLVGPAGRMALQAQHKCSRQSRRLHRRYAEWAHQRRQKYRRMKETAR